MLHSIDIRAGYEILRHFRLFVLFVLFFFEIIKRLLWKKGDNDNRLTEERTMKLLGTYAT